MTPKARQILLAAISVTIEELLKLDLTHVDNINRDELKDAAKELIQWLANK